jgi:hypothetical protein
LEKNLEMCFPNFFKIWTKIFGKCIPKFLYKGKMENRGRKETWGVGKEFFLFGFEKENRVGCSVKLMDQIWAILLTNNHKNFLLIVENLFCYSLSFSPPKFSKISCLNCIIQIIFYTIKF